MQIKLISMTKEIDQFTMGELLNDIYGDIDVDHKNELNNYIKERANENGLIPVECIIEFAGKVCYKSHKKGRNTQDYIKHILEVGHGSVLEHINYSFLITNVSRYLTHELVRHRTGCSYSQESTRYIGLEDMEPFIPDELYTEEDLLNEYNQYQELTRKLNDKIYDRFTKKGYDKKAARGIARHALMSTETGLVFSANARSLRHLFVLRGSVGADREIREMAIELLQIVKEKTKFVFDDMEIKEDEINGEFFIINKYGAV